ncbi:MAG TPA: hypothetical protein VGE77_04945 [Nocardioides sp.]
MELARRALPLLLLHGAVIAVVVMVSAGHDVVAYGVGRSDLPLDPLACLRFVAILVALGGAAVAAQSVVIVRKGRRSVGLLVIAVGLTVVSALGQGLVVAFLAVFRLAGDRSPVAVDSLLLAPAVFVGHVVAVLVVVGLAIAVRSACFAGRPRE